MASVEDGLPEEHEASSSNNDKSGYYDTNFEWIKNQRVRRAACKVYPTAMWLWDWGDYLGGKVANALGLTQSRYQYAIDEYNRQQRKKRRKEEKVQKERMERAAYWQENEEGYVPPNTLASVNVQQENVGSTTVVEAHAPMQKSDI
eukprot:PhM_4_TR13076/c0_g2_i1/m.75313